MSVTGGTQLSASLSYSSRLTSEKGSAGYGWYHNYDIRIEEGQGIIYFYTSPESYTYFIKEDRGNQFEVLCVDLFENT